MGDPLWHYKVLGLHCDGTNGSTTFTDVKGKTVTAVGNAKISTAQYPALTGKTSSGYVDGTGDYLTIPYSTDWDFGTGDFGIRIRARFTGVTTAQALVSNYLNTTTGFSVVFDGVNSKLQFLNGTTVLLDVAWSPSADTWYVIEVSRSGTSLRGFADGTQVGSTATNSTSITGSTSTLFIGARDASNQLLTGYFSEVEIYKGAPLNTANYTPSGDPFPGNYVRISGTTKDVNGNLASRLVRVYRRDTGALVEQVVSDATTGEYVVTAANNGTTTPARHVAYMHTTGNGVHVPWRVLGLHCDGANNSTAFADVTGKTVTANGNAKISTAQYPSLTGKTSSAYFDGTNSVLSIGDSSQFTLGAVNFSARMHIRFSTVPGAGQFAGIIGQRTNGVSQFAWSFIYGGTEKFYLSYSTSGTTASHITGLTTFTPTVNTWYEIEISRFGANIDVYIDGTKGTTGNIGTASIFDSSAELKVGAIDAPANYFFHGYMSDIEVCVGTAIHTASYTPSSDPFPDALGTATDNAIIFDDITPA